MENSVAKAVRLVHGPTQASFLCRVSVNTIHVWRRDGVVRDAKAAVLLAHASGVPIEDLVGLENGHGPHGGQRIGGKLSVTSSDSAATEFSSPLALSPVAQAA